MYESQSTRTAFPLGRRWLPYSSYLRDRFGSRMYKVSLDAGFSCPNADGTKAKGGCIYCDNRSFSPIARHPERGSLRGQIEVGASRLIERYGPVRFLAYFQAATNTYAPVEQLRLLYDEALSHPNVEGLIIGTRPDCVPDPVLDLLEEYARTTYVSLELGLQSLSDEVLRWSNRAHTVDCFFDAMERARGRGIDLCAHVILGFPQEKGDVGLKMGEALGGIGLSGIKIHNLHVVRDTPLATLYQRGALPLPSIFEYASRAADVLERIEPSVAVQRLSGDAPGDWLVAPDWCRHKQLVLQAIEKELLYRDSWQGKFCRAEVH